MSVAVAVDHVCKSFGAVNALNDVSLSIETGKFFGLLGPNGAGKSTLINTMAGLSRADGGTIAVMGHDVRKHWRQARLALGIVPQELAFDPFFTVREMLRLQSGYFGLGRQNDTWIEELMDILSLGDKAKTTMNHLSGGMKRRALIAQALVHKPRVVVLDEPTAGVDVELRQILWRFIRRLHQQGHTIVLTTHYLEEAEALCEQIAILDRGQLIAMDSKSNLMNLCPYRILTLEMVRPPADLPEKMKKLVISQSDRQFILRLDRRHDQIGAVLGALNAAGGRIADLRIHEPGLEEVFLSLTRGNAP